MVVKYIIQPKRSDFFKKNTESYLHIEESGQKPTK